MNVNWLKVFFYQNESLYKLVKNHWQELKVFLTSVKSHFNMRKAVKT